mmetsp:Transcript_33358/g.104747  ORF Transcript_33358/g.104747 Transcript_33358/m.104747 type:complete len:227 (-) Transcript_33358:96-776(-)
MGHVCRLSRGLARLGRRIHLPRRRVRAAVEAAGRHAHLLACRDAQVPLSQLCPSDPPPARRVGLQHGGAPAARLPTRRRGSGRRRRRRRRRAGQSRVARRAAAGTGAGGARADEGARGAEASPARLEQRPPLRRPQPEPLLQPLGKAHRHPGPGAESLAARGAEGADAGARGEAEARARRHPGQLWARAQGAFSRRGAAAPVAQPDLDVRGVAWTAAARVSVSPRC